MAKDKTEARDWSPFDQRRSLAMFPKPRPDILFRLRLAAEMLQIGSQRREVVTMIQELCDVSRRTAQKYVQHMVHLLANPDALEQGQFQRRTRLSNLQLANLGIMVMNKKVQPDLRLERPAAHALTAL